MNRTRRKTPRKSVARNRTAAPAAGGSRASAPKSRPHVAGGRTAGRPKAGGRSRVQGGEPERLQKVLARAGLASRREVEDWIRAGRITVNNEPAILGTRVVTGDHVRLDGRLVHQRATGGTQRVFLCHRSPGESLKPPEDVGNPESHDESPDGRDHADAPQRAPGAERSAMMERIPRSAGRRFIAVSPMPRVDGGLELVTSDGDLASRLQRSIRFVTSEFSVRVHGELSENGIAAVLEGQLDTGEKLAIEQCDTGGGEGSNRWYTVTSRGASGKDVRQLFERQGALVSRVLRTRLGSLALDRHLSRGRFRELLPAELEALLGDTTGASALSQ